MWIDNDFPKLLGAELYRPHPAYIIEMAVEPVVVHDFSKQPGQTVQLDRYRFWGKPGTKESRERTADQTLGSASARNIVKDKVLVTLREYTGPADSRDSTQPSTFKVARETLITAQRLLLDTGNLNVFHQSIGSLTLLDDYRRWRDRVFANELLKAEACGKADSKIKAATTCPVVKKRILVALAPWVLPTKLANPPSSTSRPTCWKSLRTCVSATSRPLLTVTTAASWIRPR